MRASYRPGPFDSHSRKRDESDDYSYEDESGEPQHTGNGASAARQGIFDQVIDVVEGDVVDRPLDLEEPRRLAL